MSRLPAIVAILLALVAAGLAPASARADTPSAEEVFERFVRAVGGEEAFRSIKARIVEGVLENRRSNYYGRITEYRQAPNKAVLDFEMPGVSSATTGFDGTTAWSRDLSGARIVEGEESLAVRESADFSIELGWRSRFTNLRAEGLVDFEGKQAFKVNATAATNGVEQSIYFDPSTWLLVGFDSAGRKATQPGGRDEPPARLIISEYKDFGSVKYATRFVQRRGDQEITWWYTRIELNPETMPSFAPPPEAKRASESK